MRRRQILTVVTGLAIIALSVVVSPAFATTVRAAYEVPATVDSTGATDVTASLTSFIDSVPDGSTVRFPAHGRFRVDGTLRFQGRNDLTIDGNGATTFAGTMGNRTRSEWRFLLGRNLTIRNLTIRGANSKAGTSDAAYVAPMEAQHGIELAGVAGVNIDSVTVTDVFGDFIYLGAYIAKTYTWTSDVKIHGSRLERNGRQGISMTGARNVEIYDNYIGDTRRATLDLEPNGSGWGVVNVSVHDNRIGPGRLNFISAMGSGPVNMISIKNNVLVGKAMNMAWSPPLGTRRQGLTIVGNTSDVGYGNNGGAPINVARYDGVTITKNVQRLQRARGMAGVDVWESCEVDISGGQFVNAITDSRIRAYLCPLGTPTTLSMPTNTVKPVAK